MKSTQTANRKLERNLRISSWLSLLPAAYYFRLYQMSNSIWVLLLALVALGAGLFLYLNGSFRKWNSRSKLFNLAIFQLLFVGILAAIPVFFSFKYADRKD